MLVTLYIFWLRGRLKCLKRRQLNLLLLEDVSPPIQEASAVLKQEIESFRYLTPRRGCPLGGGSDPVGLHMSPGLKKGVGHCHQGSFTVDIDG